MFQTIRLERSLHYESFLIYLRRFKRHALKPPRKRSIIHLDGAEDTQCHFLVSIQIRRLFNSDLNQEEKCKRYRQFTASWDVMALLVLYYGLSSRYFLSIYRWVSVEIEAAQEKNCNVSN